MNISARLDQLRRKHQALADEVEEAQRAPSVDALSVIALKKQKLRLKEEIVRLSAQ